MKIDKKIIKELSDYLKEFNLTEIEITEKDTKIKVSKNNVSISNQPQVISSSSPASSSIPTQTQNIKSGTEITSPIIGTAYHAPEPGAKKFVEIGKKIKKGDTIMIVEAMKTMNHVPSTADGVVKEICVEDGQPVEFGQILEIVLSNLFALPITAFCSCIIVVIPNILAAKTGATEGYPPNPRTLVGLYFIINKIDLIKDKTK